MTARAFRPGKAGLAEDSALDDNAAEALPTQPGAGRFGSRLIERTGLDTIERALAGHVDLAGRVGQPRKFRIVVLQPRPLACDRVRAAHRAQLQPVTAA